MRNSRPTPEQKKRLAAEAVFTTGVTLQDAKRHGEAIAAFRRTLGLWPGYVAAWNNLGISLGATGDLQAAIECFEKAIGLRPNAHQPHLNLANQLRRLGRTTEAIAAYERALALKPDYVTAYYGLGSSFEDLGQHERGSREIRRALALDPKHVGALVQVFKYDMSLCAFTAAEASHRQLVAALPAYAAAADSPAILLNVGYFNLFAPIPPALMRDLAACASTLLANAPVRPPAAPGALDPERRLRIGYVSPNFGNHPVGHVTRSLFALHDRRQVEVYAYAIGKRGRGSGDFFATISAGVDHLVDIAPVPPRAAAERIAQDQIDILIDLDGYMDATSPAIFAHRPAPIQVFWLGHAGGLGFGFMDYLIADRVVLPPGEEGDYAEAIVRLPEIYHVTDRAPIAAATPSRAEQGLADDAIVFCAFNNPGKIDRRIFSVWMRIMAAVPGSLLWLSPPARYGDHRPNLRREAEAAGIDPERLVFAARAPEKADHLARHRLADLFLDTVTVNAATTALDALWAGLPVLTCKGDRFANRMAETFLAAMDLGDLIAPDLDAYAERAIALARDPAARAALRQRLARAHDASPVFDTGRFTRHLEAAYRLMWRRHAAGLAPAGIEVPPLARPPGA